MIFGGISKKHYYSAFPENEKREFYKSLLKKSKDKRPKNNDDDDEEDGPKLDLSKLIGFNGGGSSGVTRHKNHIYFYDSVSTESCLELNRELAHLAKDLQFYSLEHDCKPAKIYLHINSYGGELLACFSTVDYIRNCPIPVVSIIEGCAASAATLISVVAKERYMTQSSWMLIHQLRGGYWGKFDEMEEDLSNSKKFMEKIYEIYEERTNLTGKDLRKMLKRDEWWDYETCLKYGLIDGVYGGWAQTNVVKKPKKSGPVKVKSTGDIVKKVKKLIELPKKKHSGKKDSKRKRESNKKDESKKKDEKGKKTENYVGVVTRSVAQKYGIDF